MRGQSVTVSTLAWIVLIFIFLTFIFLFGYRSYEIVTDSMDSNALFDAVDKLYITAESLPAGSTTELSIRTPEGVTDMQVIQAPDGKWELRLTYDGELVRRVSMVKVLYLPDNLLELDGVHRLRITKENEYAAIVEEMQVG